MLIDIDPATEAPDDIGEIDWDSREAVRGDGKVLFVDEDGGEWTFDQPQVEPLRAASGAMRFVFTPVSRNAKAGPIPVVTADKTTCPSSCRLRGAGSYAEHGPLALLWARMPRAIAFAEPLARIGAMPRGQVWRYGQAGDCRAAAIRRCRSGSTHPWTPAPRRRKVVTATSVRWAARIHP